MEDRAVRFVCDNLIFGTVNHIDPIKVKFLVQGHKSEVTAKVRVMMHVTVGCSGLTTSDDLLRMGLN